MPSFTYRGARSGSLTTGLCLVIAIETVVLHLWLARAHPVPGWMLTIGSIATIAWLVADYVAFGRGTVRVDDVALDIRIGFRSACRIPRTAIRDVVRPTWRELSGSDAHDRADYRNLTAPATPNILLTLEAAADVRMMGGIVRRFRRLGLCLDEPEAFVALVRPKVG